MKTKRLSALALLLAAFTVCATPALANPGNGNGNGNGNGHGNSGNHGNGNKGNNGKNADNKDKEKGNASGRKNYGKPDHVESDISFSRARSLAVNYGLTGYEWKMVGDDLVLIALSTALVTAVINNVFG
ncbi:hypothetical protein ACI1AG_001780 [Cronobacter turicensis]